MMKTVIPVASARKNASPVGLTGKHVFINLLENACKYTPAGTPIEITAKVVADRLIVEVNDRGPGVPVGSEDRLFDKFHRGGRATEKPGAGLGLAIGRGIVEAHGGTITAQNRVGGGATLRLELLLGEPPALPEVAPHLPLVDQPTRGVP